MVSVISEPSSACTPLRGCWSSTTPPGIGLSTNRCTSTNFASRSVAAAPNTSRFTTSGTATVGGRSVTTKYAGTAAAMSTSGRSIARMCRARHTRRRFGAAPGGVAVGGATTGAAETRRSHDTRSHDTRRRRDDGDRGQGVAASDAAQHVGEIVSTLVAIAGLGRGGAPHDRIERAAVRRR